MCPSDTGNRPSNRHTGQSKKIKGEKEPFFNTRPFTSSAITVNLRPSSRSRQRRSKRRSELCYAHLSKVDVFGYLRRCRRRLLLSTQQIIGKQNQSFCNVFFFCRRKTLTCKVSRTEAESCMQNFDGGLIEFVPGVRDLRGNLLQVSEGLGRFAICLSQVDG